MHGITKDESDDIGVRYSFTFRDVAPQYLNSTIILGDSNTQHVKFGSGKGTLGSWMPGKRIKAGHIGALPDVSNVGPYRNIIIHTGVNNINNVNHRQSNRALMELLEERIKSYVSTYPKTKIFVSLLLPSRSTPLNHRIRELNNLILDMTCRLDRVSVIENTIFGDSLSDEHGRWRSCDTDSNDFEPNINDILHLGKRGIRLLAMNFKNCIVSKNKTQSRERFNGGRGSYRRAVVRGQNLRDTSQS